MSIPVSSMFLSTTRSTRLNPNLVPDSLIGSSPHTAIRDPSPNATLENLSGDIPPHVVLGSQDTTHHQLVPFLGSTMENIDHELLLNAHNGAPLLALTQEDSSDLNSSTPSSLPRDILIFDIQNEMELSVLRDLRDVDALVAAYEKRSGNRLRIIRSGTEKYRTYECCGHVDCKFQLRFSRSIRHGYYSLRTKDKKLVHKSERVPPLARGGRRRKIRRRGQLDDVWDRVITTKHAPPTPADIIKTAATMKNEIIPYQVGYRRLNEGGSPNAAATVKNFQLIGPYLNEMKNSNPGSVIGYSRTDTNEIVDLYFFPGFVNESMEYVRPMISLDAAHLKSEYAGTMYIASVLSGNNDIYPIGFMISHGNENLANWTKMLLHLREAFPIVSDVNRLHPFVFVSDRCKGLKQSLHEIFPNNVETSCAFHIKQNVEQRYGQAIASNVMSIAKTYSLRQYEHLVDGIRRVKPVAAAYIEDVTCNEIWCNSQSMNDTLDLPRRFGIITSNTAESVNSMFDSARNLVWLDAMEKMIDIMLTRICKLRETYSTFEDCAVVKTFWNNFHASWEGTASMSVIEVQVDSSIFQTTTSVTGSGPNVREGKHHIVKLREKWCSCGVWNDTMLPCKHVIAVYRHKYNYDEAYIANNHIPSYYKYEYLKKMLQKNIYPVCLDTLAYDGETKPPHGQRRGRGRPKKGKRLRSRSAFASESDSNITCSTCHGRGHNKRTCARRPLPEPIVQST